MEQILNFLINNYLIIIIISLCLLIGYTISASMSRKSSPWENGSQESFYGKLKFELGNVNRFGTLAEVIEAIHLYIYYYNNNRIHTALKMTPVQFAILHS